MTEPDFWHIYSVDGEVGEIVAYEYLAMAAPKSEPLYREEKLEEARQSERDRILDTIDANAVVHHLAIAHRQLMRLNDEDSDLDETIEQNRKLQQLFEQMADDGAIEEPTLPEAASVTEPGGG